MRCSGSTVWGCGNTLEVMEDFFFFKFVRYVVGDVLKIRFWHDV
jgi:hypothetical protein